MFRSRAALTSELQSLMSAEPIDLARAALTIAKLEHPTLDPTASLDQLRWLGDAAARAVAPLRTAPAAQQLAAVARVVYVDAGFAGNHAHYDDYRNSLLNVVLERRLGIPITLAVVFMEAARGAGVPVQGIAFPGHFLLRGGADDQPLILDPFDGACRLTESDVRILFARMAGEDAVYSPDLLQPCTPRQIVTRMLNNLKRTYVELRSFPQAWAATDLILAADPSMLSELRDRGLLAYHLDDHHAALRDLEEYVRLQACNGDADRSEREDIWNHIKALRRRVASWN